MDQWERSVILIIMLRAYRYRIYPTPEQQVMIEKTFGVCRFVYNAALETKAYAWLAARKNLTSIDLCYQLPDLKEGFPWIGEVDSQAVQAAVKKLDGAFEHFFAGAGYPKFKTKSGLQSFQCPNNTRKVDWVNKTLTIPKIASIPIALSRPFSGTIKTVTISRTPTRKYFASLLVDNHKELPTKPAVTKEKALGIDLGLLSFVVASDNQRFDPNRFLKNSLGRLQYLQHRASRKKKGSQNRRKANMRVARLHERIHNQRLDCCHQITTQLVRDSQAETILVEDLAVANMQKNRKLSQAISDAAWGECLRQIQYKCAWYGKNLVWLDRFAPSSKTCSLCGAINQTLKLSDREWTCAHCGTNHDRDLNAAINIRDMGLKQYWAGAGSSGVPVESRRSRRTRKQE
jgi:putative transposase